MIAQSMLPFKRKYNPTKVVSDKIGLVPIDYSQFLSQPLEKLIKISKIEKDVDNRKISNPSATVITVNRKQEIIKNFNMTHVEFLKKYFNKISIGSLTSNEYIINSNLFSDFPIEDSIFDNFLDIPLTGISIPKTKKYRVALDPNYYMRIISLSMATGILPETILHSLLTRSKEKETQIITRVPTVTRSKTMFDLIPYYLKKEDHLEYSIKLNAKLPYVPLQKKYKCLTNIKGTLDNTQIHSSGPKLNLNKEYLESLIQKYKGLYKDFIFSNYENK